jgi:hypothetical protein
LSDLGATFMTMERALDAFGQLKASAASVVPAALVEEGGQ